MTKIRAFAGVLALLLTTAARAEWLQVGTSSSDSVWYMDPKRVKVVSGKVQAWVKVDSRKDRSVQWSESKQLISFDCSADSSKTLSVIKYDSYGKMISSSSSSEYGYGTGYSPIVPDSIGETLERLACRILPENRSN